MSEFENKVFITIFLFVIGFIVGSSLAVAVEDYSDMTTWEKVRTTFSIGTALGGFYALIVIVFIVFCGLFNL